MNSLSFSNHHAATGCHNVCCLKVNNLGVSSQDGKQILHDVNLHIHCGQIVAVIGPNGAGKSTLFKAILGQLPYTGSIHFETSGGHPALPRVGYVPQSPAFDPGEPITVLDLLAAAVFHWPVCLPIPKEKRRQIFSLLKRVRGEDLMDHKVCTLSGGELQRVLLAMALEPLPHILILDEPLSGVDIEGVTQLMNMLDAFRLQYDLSILLSTHDFDSLHQYADQAVLLNETVLTSGTPEEVLSSAEFRRIFHLEEAKRSS